MLNSATKFMSNFKEDSEHALDTIKRYSLESISQLGRKRLKNFTFEETAEQIASSGKSKTSDKRKNTKVHKKRNTAGNLIDSSSNKNTKSKKTSKVKGINSDNSEDTNIERPEVQYCFSNRKKINYWTPSEVSLL